MAGWFLKKEVRSGEKRRNEELIRDSILVCRRND
jgi:hypothetical protein